MSASSLVDLPNGERVNYRVEGREAAPWLTLSNSLVTDLTLWDEFVAAVRDRYRILRYDQRGHGGSPPSKVAFDIPGLAGDVVALWDHLGIRRSHMVGVSMGGGVTLALAIHHGDRLLSCVPCDCRADFTATRRDWEPRVAKARAEGVAAMAEPTVSRWFTPASQEAKLPVIDRVRAMIAATPLAGYEGGVNALVTTDLSAGISSIAVPTMLVVGEKDGMVDAIHALGREIRGSSVTVIKDAGHLPMVEQPAEFARVVGGFLEFGHGTRCRIMTDAKPRGLLVVGLDVEPELEPELLHWYNDEHIPELMQLPGFLRARRFVAVWEGSPKYLAVFDLESPEALQSREYLELPVTPLRARLRPQFKNLNRRLYSEIFRLERK